VPIRSRGPQRMSDVLIISGAPRWTAVPAWPPPCSGTHPVCQKLRPEGTHMRGVADNLWKYVSCQAGPAVAERQLPFRAFARRRARCRRERGLRHHDFDDNREKSCRADSAMARCLVMLLVAMIVAPCLDRPDRHTGYAPLDSYRRGGTRELGPPPATILRLSALVLDISCACPAPCWDALSGLQPRD